MTMAARGRVATGPVGENHAAPGEDGFLCIDVNMAGYLNVYHL